MSSVPGFCDREREAREETVSGYRIGESLVARLGNTNIAYGTLAEIHTKEGYAVLEREIPYTSTRKGIIKKPTVVRERIPLDQVGLTFMDATKEAILASNKPNPWVEYRGKPISAIYEGEQIIAVPFRVFPNHVVFKNNIDEKADGTQYINKGKMIADIDKLGEPTLLKEPLESIVDNYNRKLAEMRKQIEK